MPKVAIATLAGYATLLDYMTKEGASGKQAFLKKPPQIFANTLGYRKTGLLL